VGGTGELSVMDPDRQGWMAHACALVARVLTREEWARYVAELPYDPAC